MALQVWLPLNKDTNVIPNITEFTKESYVTLTEDSNGWYKVADSYHTGGRWGIYKNFDVKPNTTYTLRVYSKSTTGVTAQIAVQSFATTAWPNNRDTNATSTEKLTTYSWTTGNTHTTARVYLTIACTSTVANNYVFFKDPVIYENFSNQGLTNITATNYNASVNDNGKIGKCYSFGTVLSYMTIPKEAMTSFTTEATVCFWLKILTWNTSYSTFFQAGLASNPWNSYTFGFLRNSTNSTCCFTISNGSSSTTNTCLTPALELNKWYHICLSYKTGYQFIYINGELVNTKTTSIVPNFAGITTIILGISGNKSSYQSNCLMNDVRIYDHCLSSKEVKEISKGLVLHYPLNIFPKKTNLITFDLSTSNYNISNYASRTSGNITNGVYHVDGYQYSTSIDTSFYVRSKTYLTLSSNTDYYLSFYCKCKNAVDVYFHNNYNYVKTGFLDDSSKYYGAVELVNIGTEYNGYVILKLHTGDSTQYKISLGFDIPNLYGIDSYIEFSLLKLTAERPTELELGLLVFEDNIIHDCSGYKNDGTINGTLDSNTNTPRYNYSTKFNGTSYIYRTPLDCSSEIKTISFWANWNTFESEYYNQSVLFIDNGTKTAFGLTSSGILLTTSGAGSSYIYSKSSLVINTWYHFVIIITGTTTRDLYINGVKQTTKSNTSVWSYTTNLMQIGKRSTTSDGFNGKMSDFRIYATALSADDILELYNTSAIVDNKGNSYCYLFTNNSELGEFTKLGIGKFDLIENEQLQSFIYKEVKPNLLSGTYPGIPKKTMTTSTTEFGTFFNPTELLLTGVNYTISMRIRGTAPMCIYTINTGGNLRFDLATRALLSSTDYQLKQCTFKVTGDRTINLIYICTKYGDTLSGEWFEVEPYSIKLEEGNTCTPWIPAETDDMYRSYGKTLYSNELIEI